MPKRKANTQKSNPSDDNSNNSSTENKTKKAKKAVKQKNPKATEKPPTKAQKQKDEIKKCAKINMYFQVSDMESKLSLIHI